MGSVSQLRHTLADMTEVNGRGGSERVPTWRVGVLLTREEKARLTPAQLQQYLDDSVVLDLSEIEHMPEPMRSWARAAIDDARARASAHIAEQERTQAS
jgi:hypothetical protein